jgi:hypothetical protein
VASGLYLMNNETIMVDYGTRKIPISRAQYRANGYKPAVENLIEGPQRSGKSSAVPSVLGRPHESKKLRLGR